MIARPCARRPNGPRPAAAPGAGGVLKLRHRMGLKALAFGVRARDGGAIGILSITDTQTKTAWDT